MYIYINMSIHLDAALNDFIHKKTSTRSSIGGFASDGFHRREKKRTILCFIDLCSGKFS